MHTVRGLVAPPSPCIGTSTTDGGAPTSTVLLPLCNGEEPPQALELARSISVGLGTGLTVLNAVCLPEQTPLELPEERHSDHHETVTSLLDSLEDTSPDIPTEGAIHVGHDRFHLLSAAVDSYAPAVVILDESWHETPLGPLRGSPLEKLSRTIESPIAMLTTGTLPETVSSVLVPVAGGPHSEAATEIAQALATSFDAALDLLHVITSTEPAHRRTGEELLAHHAASFQAFENYDTWLLEADNVEDAILEQTQYYDVTVIGAPRTPRLRRAIFGSTSQAVQETGENAVVTVWG